MQEKIALKKACKSKLEAQIADWASRMQGLQKDLEADDKGSMGDKYETARAMLQMEMDKAGIQLSRLREQYALLGSLPDGPCAALVPGAIVHTEKENYFISLPLGKIVSGKKEYICISLQSPLGQAMKAGAAKKKFAFQGKTVAIKNIV